VTISILGVGRRGAIGVKSGAERAQNIDVLIEEVAQVQLEEAIRTATDLLLEDTTELSVLRPALVLFQNLDEARPLGDLEARQ
jgi:hypothetical protein